jgi:mannose-6-phosphate isomerase-like protein (cupin superfamily)
MTEGLTRPTESPTIPYAGQPLHLLAGSESNSPWTIAELVVPPHFPGPIPHVHATFDEGIYVIDGTLQIISGRADPAEAPAGSFFTARRGLRHTFSNPSDQPVRVLGLWSPAQEALHFMRDVGAALPAAGPPDREALRAIYEQHHSYLQP